MTMNNIQLTEEERTWINEQITFFDNDIRNNKNLTDYQVKVAYDTYFDGVYEMYQKYKTKYLTNFCIKGIDYDGYMPGKNANFIALYEDLINMLRELRIDKPIRYFNVINDEFVLIEETEDGIKRVIERT